MNLIYPRFIVRPSASIASRPCSTRSPALTIRPTYPPYNIERLTENEYRITYHGGRWVRQARRQDRGEGKHTLDPRREKK
jgi:hypothetical protein